MADCAGDVLRVAVMEDGSAQVNLPVENWRDVKALTTVGQYEGAVRVLLADQQVRIYDGPSGAMVDVCINYLSDEEKQARDQAEAEAAKASIAEVHAPRVDEAQAQVEEVKAAAENEAAADEERAAAAERLAAAEKALADAQKARDEALSEVERG